MTVTFPELTLQDLVWDDGTVRSIDSSFPVDVAGPDFIVPKAKVLLALLPDGSYALAAWTDGTPPDLALLRRVTSLTSLKRSLRVVQTDEGEVHWTPSRGCGCGSKLKAWRPWGTEARVVGSPRPKLD